ncbi:hypothetical protein Tco_0678734 [Tanacetum coccineum]|uniref:Uncharacterized protein n=1 Tax=Tanacetum coccineum TaxID=301880 RepID=A0ABQ4XFW5_9ASTR
MYLASRVFSTNLRLYRAFVNDPCSHQSNSSRTPPFQYGWGGNGVPVSKHGQLSEGQCMRGREEKAMPLREEESIDRLRGEDAGQKRIKMGRPEGKGVSVTRHGPLRRTRHGAVGRRKHWPLRRRKHRPFERRRRGTNRIRHGKTGRRRHGTCLQLYANPSTHYYINLGIPDIQQSLADFTFSLLPQTLKVYIEEEDMIGVCGLWNIFAFRVVTGSDHQGEKAS